MSYVMSFGYGIMRFMSLVMSCVIDHAMSFGMSMCVCVYKRVVLILLIYVLYHHCKLFIHG